MFSPPSGVGFQWFIGKVQALKKKDGTPCSVLEDEEGLVLCYWLRPVKKKNLQFESNPGEFHKYYPYSSCLKVVQDISYSCQTKLYSISAAENADIIVKFGEAVKKEKKEKMGK